MRYLLKVGAQCGKTARWDLCGGHRATGVPTATKDEEGILPRPRTRWVLWTQRGGTQPSPLSAHGYGGQAPEAHEPEFGFRRTRFRVDAARLTSGQAGRAFHLIHNVRFSKI